MRPLGHPAFWLPFPRKSLLRLAHLQPRSVLVPRASLRPSPALRRPFWRGSRPTSLPSASRALSHSWPRSLAQSSSSSTHDNGKRPGNQFEWYYIPVGVGVALLAVIRVYKISTGSPHPSASEQGQDEDHGKTSGHIKGPWQVRVMSTLPLKAISRLWGRFNELKIPYYLRVPGFKLYSFIFGVDLTEVAEPDLHMYPNLAAFFYRTLKPGLRPLDQDPNALVSPADGRVLQFGRIHGGNIEQVKGVTYSIDALLGRANAQILAHDNPSEGPTSPGPLTADESLVRQDEEFARINDISYTLPGLLSGTMEQKQESSNSSRQHQAQHQILQQLQQTKQPLQRHQQPAIDDKTYTIEDQSVVGETSAKAVSEVRKALSSGSSEWSSQASGGHVKTALFYVVVYLAPGDYHRFHSPTNWVVERRRHFAGELFSVSPYLQRKLPGLFTLNERVALLGRWRWGFFGFVPVGATNVGSIKVNFDRELRTNSLTTDTAADRADLGFSEATYAAASSVLGGHALRRGDEMGGFRLGSTVVLVFEAPIASAAKPSDHRPGFHWAVEKGQRVKVGQALGRIY